MPIVTGIYTTRKESETEKYNVGRGGPQACLISKPLWVRVPPPQQNNWFIMKENEDFKPVMVAIAAKNMRDLVAKANKEGVQKEDIVAILQEGDQVVLTYYR